MEKNQRTLLIIAAAVAVILLILLLMLPLRDRMAAPSPTFTAVPTISIPSPTAGTGVPTASGTPQIASSPTPRASQAATSTTIPQQANAPSATAQGPKEFYVSTEGKESADGSKEKPWSLQYALSGPKDLHPGDTVWVRGGQYVGTFTCSLKGAEGKPVTIRAFPGERAILANDTLVLDIASSSYVNLWGLEITATQNPRDPETRPDSGYGVRINQGKPSDHINFINMIVHDMPAQGFGWWQANTDSQIYGSLIYFNGVTELDHGIYVHNNTGQKTIADNIIFDNASHGIHAYGEKDYQGLNNIQIIGNTVFDNGSIGYSTKLHTFAGMKRNILIGGDSLVAVNPVVKDNYTYFPSGINSGEAFNLGYRAGSKDAVVENNYFGGGSVSLGGDNANIQMAQNTILGFGIPGISALGRMGNDFLAFKPQEPKIFVRPNQFESGRANITIYNWAKSDQVSISAAALKGVQIKAGDKYELHNVQDFFADIVTGTYDGNGINIPMTNHSVAQPLGLSFKPNSTFPEFGAFILIVIPPS